MMFVRILFMSGELLWILCFGEKCWSTQKLEKHKKLRSFNYSQFKKLLHIHKNHSEEYVIIIDRNLTLDENKQRRMLGEGLSVDYTAITPWEDEKDDWWCVFLSVLDSTIGWKRMSLNAIWS